MKNKFENLYYNGNKVLTNRELAESFEVDLRVISKNYRNNIGLFKDDYMYKLSGNELIEFKYNCRPSYVSKVLKTSPKICLWTKKGAYAQALILNTKKSLEIYRYLVENYYDQD